jgi:hypothetical protein
LRKHLVRRRVERDVSGSARAVIDRFLYAAPADAGVVREE